MFLRDYYMLLYFKTFMVIFKSNIFQRRFLYTFRFFHITTFSSDKILNV
ncbi:unnamed protein product [Callosobruchus maculatus]|uniref:Uncharacterized protein n=1 Tax=Callosobruchus maculatus TaxID=64391 RepID=A0A653DS28_CALMS|nr:unnamed protein product [Callosobruchus maculatus]